MYIIIWRHRTREPFIGEDTYGFIETFSTFEQAEKAAEETLKIENQTGKSQWYFDYKIYEEATN